MFTLIRSSAILGQVIKSKSQLVNLKEARFIHRWVAPTLHELYRRRKKAGPFVNPRSGYLEWNYDAELFAFAKRLNEPFNEDLLKQALTHRSYTIKEKSSNEGSVVQDNHALIQRGHELISQHITEKLREVYPDVLIKVVRDYLTTQSMLASVGTYIGLKDIVLCSVSSSMCILSAGVVVNKLEITSLSGFFHKFCSNKSTDVENTPEFLTSVTGADFPVEEATLADSFKAVVAALESSADEERAKTFINDFLLVQLNGVDVYDLWNPEKPLDYLQSLMEDAEIEPRLCNQSASNTILANYQIGLYSNKKLLGIGFGESLEEAKNTAALDAIIRLHIKEKPQIKKTNSMTPFSC